jgi:regulator of replication initiation timing
MPVQLDPNLTPTLRAEWEALRNDLEQAREMTADFQAQLSGKSTEYALLKQVFEKTAANLNQLQRAIITLREERHALANEAMRAVALEQKLADSMKERTALRAENEKLRQELGARTAWV